MGRKIFTAAFLILLAGTAASAIPLTYIESVSGDLAGQTLAFDVGINSVFGRQGLTNPITPVTVFDLDFFLFSLPAGTQLTQVTYTVLATSGTLSGGPSYILDDDGALPFLGTASINRLVSTPQNLFAGALPLSAGTYGLVQDNATPTSTDFWVVDYRWDYTVSTTSVPEPQSLTLLTIGLGAIVGRCWIARRHVNS